MNKNDKEKLMEAIGKAYRYAGQRIEAKDLVRMVDDLAELCETKHRNKTIDTICKKITDGAAGEFGDYTALSIKTLNGFIKFGDEQRTNCPQQDDEQPRPTEKRDRVADARELVNSCYKNYLQNGMWFAPSNLLLERLKADGWIVVTKEDAARYDLMAEEHMRAEFAKERMRGFIGPIMDYINKGIQSTWATLIVRDFFAGCKMEGKNKIY